jgi:two-component system NtrC family sensor kinase
VLNLLLNAAHAVGDAVKDSGDRGRITVRTRTIGDFVEISIADTGDGIPESVRGRIFEPFVTTKEVGRGTGQGLALSRGIVVERLKGSLHFETESGRGTTFFVRLPVSETQKQAAA